MSTNVTYNGTVYPIPAAGELNWSALSNFLIDLGTTAGLNTTRKQAMRVATTSPVTVSATTDCVLMSKLAAPGAVAVNLPAGVNGQWFVIGDQTGDAATNNITITPNGADTINGSATYVIAENNGCVVIAYSSTNTKWNVVARFTSGSFMTNPMTTAGDLVYGGGSGAPTRLAAGTSGQWLNTTGAGAPTWTDATIRAKTFSDTTDATSTSTGSIITAGGVGVAKAVYAGTVSTFTQGIKVKNTGAGSTTLSWYEEGTWTPVIAFATPGTSAANTQVGRFTRTGNRVHFNAYVDYNKGTGSGNVTITGLPYTSNATTNAFASVNIHVDRGVTVPATKSQVTGQIGPAASTITLLFSSLAAAAAAAVTGTDVTGANVGFIIMGHYEV